MSKKKTTETTDETGDLADNVGNADEAEVSQDWTPESAEAGIGAAASNGKTPSTFFSSFKDCWFLLQQSAYDTFFTTLY